MRGKEKGCTFVKDATNNINNSLKNKLIMSTLTKNVNGQNVELTKIKAGHYALNGFHIVKVEKYHTYYNNVARKPMSGFKTCWAYSKSLERINKGASLVEDTLKDCIYEICS